MYKNLPSAQKITGITFFCSFGASSTPKKRLLPFSGELGKIKAGSLCSAEHIYVLAIFCRIHSYTKLVLQNTQKSRKLVLQNTQKSRWS